MIKKYMNNRVFVFGLACIAFVYLMYVSMASTNVPLMDYWDYINMFVEKMYTGGLTIGDIWQNDGIHRSPLQYVFFIANVKLFNYNVQIEIYLAAFVFALISCLLYKNIKDTLENKNIWLCGIYGIIIAILVFNLNQWEMINEQFALSFTARCILFILSYILTDKYLRNIENSKTNTFELGVFYILVIILVGGGYFPAYVAAIVFCIAFYYFALFKENKNKYLGYCLFLIICLGIGAFIYMHGLNLSESTADAGEIDLILTLVNYIKGIFVMLGVSVVGFELGYKTTFVVGGILFFAYLISLILYIKYKFYRITWVPLMLYGYVFCALSLIYIGRMNMFGIDYAFSSRYVCESNLAIISFCWISFLLFDRNKKTITKKSFLFLPVILILCNIIISDKKEWDIAPLRKAYGETLIEYMTQEEELSSSQIANFQASEDHVIAGIEIMKEYKLGVFNKNFDD